MAVAKVKELFRSFKMSTRASKTEFVCKSYGPAKFAVKTGQMSGRVGHGNGNWRKQTISSDETAEIEVGQRLGSVPRGRKNENLCRGSLNTEIDPDSENAPKTAENDRKRAELGLGQKLIMHKT